MEQLDLFVEGKSDPRDRECHAGAGVRTGGDACIGDETIIAYSHPLVRERYIDQALAIAEACDECCMPSGLCCHR